MIAIIIIALVVGVIVLIVGLVALCKRYEKKMDILDNQTIENINKRLNVCVWKRSKNLSDGGYYTYKTDCGCVGRNHIYSPLPANCPECNKNLFVAHRESLKGIREVIN